MTKKFYAVPPAPSKAPSGMRWYWSTISAAWHLEAMTYDEMATRPAAGPVSRAGHPICGAVDPCGSVCTRPPHKGRSHSSGVVHADGMREYTGGWLAAPPIGRTSIEPSEKAAADFIRQAPEPWLS